MSMGEENPNIATSLMDMITAKQLGLISAHCRELHLVADNECQLKMKCLVNELSKAAASEFIQYLQNWMKDAV